MVTRSAGLGLTLWRERRSRKRRLSVAHGWQFVYDENEELIDVWVSVMAWHTGHRPIHIEHVSSRHLSRVIGDWQPRLALRCRQRNTEDVPIVVELRGDGPVVMVRR